MAAASIGLALTLLIAKTIGPRAGRTIGQILAALLGGGFYLASQLSRLLHDDAQGLYGWARSHGLDNAGASAWPGRAMFGDLAALLLMLIPAVLLFVRAGVLLQATFLSGYQDAGIRLVRTQASGRGADRAFHATLERAVFAKEWRLLVRDPALAFQIVLRLIYLVPLLLVGLRHGAGVYLAPTLAFSGVLIIASSRAASRGSPSLPKMRSSCSSPLPLPRP